MLTCQRLIFYFKLSTLSCKSSGKLNHILAIGNVPTHASAKPGKRDMNLAPCDPTAALHRAIGPWSVN